MAATVEKRRQQRHRRPSLWTGDNCISCQLGITILHFCNAKEVCVFNACSKMLNFVTHTCFKTSKRCFDRSSNYLVPLYEWCNLFPFIWQCKWNPCRQNFIRVTPLYSLKNVKLSTSENETHSYIPFLYHTLMSHSYSHSYVTLLNPTHTNSTLITHSYFTILCVTIKLHS